MALCHNCDDARTEYIGNGVEKEYLITFEYYKKEDVAVAFWDEDNQVWIPIDNSEWSFVHETLIRFKTAPGYNQKFIIYRCTDLSPLPADFFPGHSIKAEDLNNDFFVLKAAIEETRCAISRNDSKVEGKFWNKGEDTITKEQQVTGQAEAILDDEHIFTAEAIAARSDSYIQDNPPPAITYQQPGKIWNDTRNLLNYFWDPNVNTWVSFTQAGAQGPPGDFGPPGKVIVSDSPPVEYPSVGSNAARPLENGDQWFDSYNVLLYIYYIDNAGPGQWVAISTPGPKGEPGVDGGISDVQIDGKTYGRKDKNWVEILPDGVVSVVAGNGIDVDTTVAPGFDTTPKVTVKFFAEADLPDDTTLVLSSNLMLLNPLP